MLKKLQGYAVKYFFRALGVLEWLMGKERPSLPPLIQARHQARKLFSQGKLLNTLCQEALLLGPVVFYELFNADQMTKGEYIENACSTERPSYFERLNDCPIDKDAREAWKKRAYAKGIYEGFISKNEFFIKATSKNCLPHLLYYAFKENKPEETTQIIATLKENNFDLNSAFLSTVSGNILYQAACKGQFDYIRFLINIGVDPNLPRMFHSNDRHDANAISTIGSLLKSSKLTDEQRVSAMKALLSQPEKINLKCHHGNLIEWLEEQNDPELKLALEMLSSQQRKPIINQFELSINNTSNDATLDAAQEVQTTNSPAREKSHYNGERWGQRCLNQFNA